MKSSLRFVYALPGILALSASTFASPKTDALVPLAPGQARLDGFLEHDIQLNLDKWAKQRVAYNAMADLFTNGRPVFAGGETWGKAVRAACMHYRHSQDPKLKELMDDAMRYMLTKHRSNGSISCSPVEKQPDGKGGDLWERKYVLLGMQAYYLHVNPDPAVLASMVRQVDSLIEQVGPAPKTPITELGWSVNRIESSSLLEPVMVLYNLTGEKRFLDFASYIVESGGSKGYDLVDQAHNHLAPDKMAGGVYPKAYEMLSIFEGLLEYHRVTGDEKIRQAALNLFKNVSEREITITGSGGDDATPRPHGKGECWNHSAFEQTNPAITRMQETCVGVTWMKYCTQVLRLAGDPAAVDQIERYIYNALVGAQKPDGTRFSYFNLLNGTRTNPDGWGAWVPKAGYFTCCDLNGPTGLAYIPYIAVMNSATGPVVNLFNQGEFSFASPGKQNARLTLQTDYPRSGRVRAKLSLPQPEEFDLRVRIPGWSEATRVTFEGKVETPRAGTYHAIRRQWKDGDVVELELDLHCRLVNSQKDNRVAVLYGPIALTRDENLDRDFNKPVSIQTEANGRIAAVQEEPFYDAVRLQFVIPTAQGPVRMIDYASADNWNGLRVCTWMPVK